MSNNNLILVFTLLILFSGGVSAEAVTPTDVYKAVAALRADIGLIRSKLGAEFSYQTEMEIDNASPRETLVQARTLQKKCATIFSEQAGSQADTFILIPEGGVKPDHVISAVQNGHEYLKKVKSQLRITSTDKWNAPKAKYSPSDVSKSITQANRQLNLMLKSKLTPTIVYRKVEDAVNHAYVLSQQFNGATILNITFESGKKPGDVFNKLVEAFKVQSEIMAISGIKTLKLSDSVQSNPGTTPADVFDMSSLVFAEVKDTYLLLPNRKLTPGVYWPGKKSLSHVYHRAAVLDAMLISLLVKVKSDPGWLKR